jgi:hypothetical protein
VGAPHRSFFTKEATPSLHQLFVSHSGAVGSEVLSPQMHLPAFLDSPALPVHLPTCTPQTPVVVSHVLEKPHLFSTALANMPAALFLHQRGLSLLPSLQSEAL